MKIFLILLASLTGIFAQNSEPLIYTVGKVFPTSNAPIAYVLWQPGDLATTYGKQFAVYRKEGDSDSAFPYQRLGRTRLQKGHGAILAMLKLGHEFDADAHLVAGRINALAAEARSIAAPQPMPAEPGMDEAKKLASLMQAASTDPRILQRLSFLGRAHPGIFLTLGHGFAIRTNPATVHTYEVRETDPAGNDLRVIGRVTLDSANPTALPATSRPFEVPFPATGIETNSAFNHLVTHLRWGTPDELRRVLPHTFGFNLYRVTEAAAIASNWTGPGVQPNLADFQTLLDNPADPASPEIVQVNSLPIFAAKMMSEGEAADVETDPETAFTHDDKNPPEDRFFDGETFYYFVAPRDIAGHPGALSAGTRVVMCHRMPPLAPRIDSVVNVFDPTGTDDLENETGTQFNRIRIRQVAPPPGVPAIARYHIYRWAEERDSLNPSQNPEDNRVGSVDHLDGQLYVEFDDNGADAPIVTADNQDELGQTWWYTVRAEDASVCAPQNLSAHSGAEFGVLRDRVGPMGATGSLERCLLIPNTTCNENNDFNESADTHNLDFNEAAFILRGEKLDPSIAGFEMQLTDSATVPPTVLYEATQYFTRGNIRDFTIGVDVYGSTSISLIVTPFTRMGTKGIPLACKLPTDPKTPGQVLVFPLLFDVTQACFPAAPEEPGGLPLPHDVHGPDGLTVGPQITVNIPPDASEVRIYRRVGPTGEFELIFRLSAAETDGGTLPAATTQSDSAPPTVNGVEVCYFGEVIDRHGNSSGRFEINCVRIRNGDLPTPILSEATYLAEANGRARIRLDWFCPPVGVDRFEVWCASATSDDPGITSPLLSGALPEATDHLVDGDATPLSFTGYQTVRLESGQLGDSAEFSTILEVPASSRLTFTVRAVGAETFDDPNPGDRARAAGAFSNLINAAWAPLNPVPGNTIPWPALQVPGTQDIDIVINQYQPGEGPFFAFPLEEDDTHSTGILMGAFNSLTGTETISLDTDPLDIFWSFRTQNRDTVAETDLEKIYPFAIYRHRVSANPDDGVVPNLVQVSPLIDRISYRTDPTHRVIKDPFFRMIEKTKIQSGQDNIYLFPVSGTFSRDPSNFTLGDPRDNPLVSYYRDFKTFLYWVDPMPVAVGATYQYLIVHFTERGEIDRIIPTNRVQH